MEVVIFRGGKGKCMCEDTEYWSNFSLILEVNESCGHNENILNMDLMILYYVLEIKEK